MAQVKLANVLFETTPRFYTNPLLYYRAGAPVLPTSEAEVWELRGPAAFDFTTFFNALSVMKWKRYTVADSFWLHLELKGAACKVRQTRADSFSWESSCLSGEIDVVASDEWHAFDIRLEVGISDVLVAFVLETDGPVYLRNSYYYTNVDKASIRNVELALCTTTIGKEEYIRSNMSLIKSDLLERDEDAARHFTVHIVDNGRTLGVDEFGSPKIIVHPNPNVGGSGGFARGMIEAMEQQPKATHALLMDDDVSVSPESFIRTYNLLTIVNDEYADAFVSGATLSMNDIDYRSEDLGFFTYSGNFRPLKPGARMSVFHDVVSSESFTVPSDIEGCEDTTQQYAGWWYCCIPVSTIETKGLPLPLFVRSDDAEYALRCKPRFITMNGICVWHIAFFFKYSAAVERYQVSRNTFISQFASGVAELSDFMQELRHEVQLDLKKFNYVEAELALDGFEDFLKGPAYIESPVGEERFMRANKLKEKLVPIEQLRDEIARLGINIDDIVFDDVDRDHGRSRTEAAADYLTFNGQRFNNGYIKSDKVAIISAAGWVYSPGKMRRAKTLIVVDPITKNAAIRHYDPARFKKVWDRYKDDVKFYKKNKERLRREFSEAFPRLVSVDFWKNYLREAGASDMAE